CRLFSSFTWLSEGQRATARAMLQRYADLKEISRACRVRCSVYCPKLGMSTPSDGCTVWIPIELFKGDRALSVCQLVVENVDVDGGLYVGLSELESLRRGIPIEVTRWALRHGGGTTLPSVLKQALEEGLAVRCIIDSDRAYPGGPMGETARTAQAAFRELA